MKNPQFHLNNQADMLTCCTLQLTLNVSGSFLLLTQKQVYGRVL